jgi:hypothetical protein
VIEELLREKEAFLNQMGACDAFADEAEAVQLAGGYYHAQELQAAAESCRDTAMTVHLEFQNRKRERIGLKLLDAEGNEIESSTSPAPGPPTASAVPRLAPGAKVDRVARPGSRADQIPRTGRRGAKKTARRKAGWARH